MPAVRDARRSDIRAMAECAAAAFMDEELWGTVMHPHRKQFPEDFVSGFERRILGDWCRPRCRFLVGLDHNSDEVIGFAEWERQGVIDDDDGDEPAPSSWSRYLDIGHALLSTVAGYYVQGASYLRPNRAADPTKARILEESYPLFAHHWNGQRSQNWSLLMLAVHPRSQGLGVGRKLVQWGVDAADEENVHASVVSADGKEGFYAKFGFTEVGRANVGALRDNGIRGGAIMFRERRTCLINVDVRPLSP
ncbi:hypothetical protein JDV02_005605 [Purpureocillium takamizusanense]|uniref:N-acetyltransferase domain-containing protein n=1 Tax=Purpureocillium takamizusanense TaxID=2060973 RepID=A0A9Q8QHT1_9HYPO|nr:uncharacterized protein JDV02_005605 [Purpureocillium takamizusanense]UNI19421.1 hypothetical protein JDV02_005605 [Purpureocillium takamizusanense]